MKLSEYVCNMSLLHLTYYSKTFWYLFNPFQNLCILTILSILGPVFLKFSYVFMKSCKSAVSKWPEEGMPESLESPARLDQLGRVRRTSDDLLAGLHNEETRPHPASCGGAEYPPVVGRLVATPTWRLGDRWGDPSAL